MAPNPRISTSNDDVDVRAIDVGQVLTLAETTGGEIVPVWATPGGGGGVTRSIQQNNHGLSVGQAVKFDGTLYVTALADSATDAEVVGLVSAVADANHFTLAMGGYVTGLSGLTAGDVYFLSATTPGALSTTDPATVGQVSKPLLIADSSSSGYLFNFRGELIASPGGGSQPIMPPGSGSPVGVVTPTGIGYLYVDNTTPALWQAIGPTNADWVNIGGTTRGGAVDGFVLSQTRTYEIYDQVNDQAAFRVLAAAIDGGPHSEVYAGPNTMADGTALQSMLLVSGFGAWSHPAPATQPATPVLLPDVIAVLQAYGLCS
jgi:hypothetical protein